MLCSIFFYVVYIDDLFNLCVLEEFFLYVLYFFVLVLDVCKFLNNIGGECREDLLGNNCLFLDIENLSSSSVKEYLFLLFCCGEKVVVGRVNIFVVLEF